MGAERLWHLLHTEPFVRALGAVTGNQAVQMVQAGLKAIYMSGWQVAGDNNTAGRNLSRPEPLPCRQRADAGAPHQQGAAARRPDCAHERPAWHRYWMAPIVADAESGFGGTLNSFELMRAMIEAGAAGVHFEDQLASAKKCGHMGGKVLVPTREFIQKLVAARLAADVMDVPTLVVARTDADSAQLITSDVDPYDVPFIASSDRTHEGFYYINGGVEYAIARGLAYAPYADLIWCETSKPDLGEAREFAAGHPRQSSPARCWPTTARPPSTGGAIWTRRTIATFQEQLGRDGLQVPVRHAGRLPFAQQRHVRVGAHLPSEGMAAYTHLQDKEFAMEKEHGFSSRQAPELCRRRATSTSPVDRHRRHGLDHRAQRLYRRGAVRRRSLSARLHGCA
jgi:isocitrate lyase